MSWSVVQTKSTTGTTTTGGTLSGITSTTAGNLLVCCIYAYNTNAATNPTITTPSGWSAEAGIGNLAFTPVYSQVFYYPNNPGGITSVAATISAMTAGCGWGVLFLELSGGATTGQPDAFNQASPNTATTTPSVSVTTAADGDFVIGFLATNTAEAAGGITEPGGSWTTVTSISDGNGDGTLGAAWQVQSAHGAITYNPTSTASQTYSINLIAFGAAGGGGGGGAAPTPTAGPRGQWPNMQRSTQRAALTLQPHAAFSGVNQNDLTAGLLEQFYGDGTQAEPLPAAHGAWPVSPTRRVQRAALTRAPHNIGTGTNANDLLTLPTGSAREFYGLWNGPAVTIPRTGVKVAAGASLALTSGPLAPLTPIISKGQPTYGPANGYPANYLTDRVWTSHGFWRSVDVPSSGTPVNVSVDLSAVSSGQRGQVVVRWVNGNGNYWNDSAEWASLPKDYTLQGNTAAGGTLPTTGWTTISTITSNIYTTREHKIDLTGYNWFRMSITASNGTSPNNDIQMVLDIYNNADTKDQDDWLFAGDSITREALDLINISGSAWNPTYGPLEDTIHATKPGYTPLIIDGGWGGMTMGWLDTNFVGMSGGFSGRYFVAPMGTNDVNVGFAWTQTNVDAWYASCLSVVDKAIAAGFIPVIPLIPWGSANSGFLGTNAQTVNTYLTAHLTTDRPGAILGPDLWTPFNNNHALIDTDGIHPTFTGTSPVGLEVWQQTWHDWMVANIYGGSSSQVNAGSALALKQPSVGVNAGASVALQKTGVGVSAGASLALTKTSIGANAGAAIALKKTAVPVNAGAALATKALGIPRNAGAALAIKQAGIAQTAAAALGLKAAGVPVAAGASLALKALTSNTVAGGASLALKTVAIPTSAGAAVALKTSANPANAGAAVALKRLANPVAAGASFALNASGTGLRVNAGASLALKQAGLAKNAGASLSVKAVGLPSAAGASLAVKSVGTGASAGASLALQALAQPANASAALALKTVSNPKNAAAALALKTSANPANAGAAIALKSVGLAKNAATSIALLGVSNPANASAALALKALSVPVNAGAHVALLKTSNPIAAAASLALRQGGAQNAAASLALKAVSVPAIAAAAIALKTVANPANAAVGVSVKQTSIPLAAAARLSLKATLTQSAGAKLILKAVSQPANAGARIALKHLATPVNAGASIALSTLVTLSPTALGVVLLSTQPAPVLSAALVTSNVPSALSAILLDVGPRATGAFH